MNEAAMSIDDYATMCHDANAAWWPTDEELEQWGEIHVLNLKLAKMTLITSEVIESAEGVRKGIADDKIPEFSMETAELADVLIRVFDYAGKFNLPLQAAFWTKLGYNATRYDHTLEARNAEGGKKI